jgi:hypothetical protein
VGDALLDKCCRVRAVSSRVACRLTAYARIGRQATRAMSTLRGASAAVRGDMMKSDPPRGPRRRTYAMSPT